MPIDPVMRPDFSPAVEKLLEGFAKTAPVPLSDRERKVEGAGAILFLAVAVPMALLLTGGEPFRLWVAVILALAYALVSRVRFAVGYGYTVPTQLIFMPMLFLLPPGVVPLAVVAGVGLANVPDYVTRRRHPDRALLIFGDAWHAVGPAAVFALAGAGQGGWEDLPIYVSALGSQFAFDMASSTIRAWLSLGIAPGLQPSLMGWVFLVDLCLTPVGLLAAFAALDAPLSVLAVLPLAALLAIFARERQRRIGNALELSHAYRGTTLLLGDVLEADDEYTGMHSRGVVSLAVAVADEMGLDAEARRNVEFGALLHDVGKIAVPTEIINKAGPLTPEEWTVIKTHTIEGQRMLDQVGGVLSEVGRIVRSSHERWDGTGYPDCLANGEIPLESAIVCCCDAFDAMTTDRAYRDAMPTEQALEELAANSGSQFNPAVVEVVAQVVQRDLRTDAERVLRAPGTAP